MFQSLIGILWTSYVFNAFKLTVYVSIPYRYSMNAWNHQNHLLPCYVSIPYRYSMNPCNTFIMRANSVFQSLIGILWTGIAKSITKLWKKFQSLIGILWTSSTPLTLSSVSTFQSLIGILWTVIQLGCSQCAIQVSIPYRYSMNLLLLQ